MQRTFTTAVLALLLLAHPSPRRSLGGDIQSTLTDARALLQKQDAATAVARLEAELAAVPPADRASLLALLKDSYAQAIREAEAASRAR